MSAKQPYVRKSSTAIGVEKNILQQNCEDNNAILKDLLALSIDIFSTQLRENTYFLPDCPTFYWRSPFKRLAHALSIVTIN